jgi:hypothetical protein
VESFRATTDGLSLGQESASETALLRTVCDFWCAVARASGFTKSDSENRQIFPVLQPSAIADAFSESKCICLYFEIRDVRSIETPVSKSFRPRGVSVRKPRHPAQTRDVTPVFSVAYAHAAAGGVSLPPMETTHARPAVPAFWLPALGRQ